METLVADFYVGFEGEPEVTLLRAGAETCALKTWEGYFLQVLDAIEPGEDGNWQGLVLHYHLGTGWYDAEAFEVEDAPLFAAQLSAVAASRFEPGTRRFYEALLSFVRAAVEQREKLVIQYF